MVAGRSPSRMALPITAGSLLKRSRPEAMGEHRRARGLRPVVAWRRAGGRSTGAQPHHLEVGAADDAGANDARLAEADHRELDGREVAEAPTAT